MSMACHSALAVVGVGAVGGVGVDPSPRANYIGKIYYRTTSGDYHYLKLITRSTLRACQTEFFQQLGHIQTSPLFEVEGHLEYCRRN